MLKTFLQHNRVVLCKRRFEKAVNIRKMRPFRKLTKPATKQGFASQKLEMQKNMLKTFQTFQLFYAKNGSKKQLLFQT